jgi:biopolymer transport protein ExbB
MGVILRSVTADGWVVIGLLGAMSLTSWVVMISKTLTLGRITRANDRFLGEFRGAEGNFEKLQRECNTDEADDFSASSIYRIFDMGMSELERRFAANANPAAARTLVPQSLAAIRASLDQVATREGQRLNAAIVLLTIAISGGPFLGLLGTVIGVMITFAAIAAAGDVNINAIAPGMAAALVATVAGLSVAIPALFGYNYLVTRIRDLTADMHVFVDEFATRVAETYRVGGSPQNLAAE